MTLTDLIVDLKAPLKDNPGFEKSKELIEDRIIIPQTFKLHEAKLNSYSHSLTLSGAIAEPYGNQEVIDEFLEMSRHLDLDNITEVKYGVSWTPEDFRHEKKLIGLFLDEVRV